MSITGTPDEPVKVAISVADIAAGMYAYSGILTALLMRHQTGAGSVLEVSMLEALGEWMGYPMYYGTYGEADPPRTGARHAAIAPYGPFASGDGEVVYLGVQNEREWRAFCAQVLRRAELAGDRRDSSRTRHVSSIERRSTRRSSACSAGCRPPRFIERLESARIANARLRTVRQFADHPQLAARGRWHEVETPIGPVRGAGAASHDRGTSSRSWGRFQAVGEPHRRDTRRFGFRHGDDCRVEWTTVWCEGRNVEVRR